MFSRLPGIVSRYDVDFVKGKQKVFSLSGKIVFIWDKNYRENFSSHEHNVTFHIISQQGEISLV